ncbi:MAG TPA: hypothetical protein VLD19_01020 [Chitinophagaceae bacterium]|nr:hypothetical protein [Chitinophagaceae bacterium]
MKKIRGIAVINAVAFLLQLTVTYLVQSRLINTFTVGQVSDKYTSLFTPAGVTFAIWGLIYLALGVFCVYHLIMAWTKPATDPANKDLLQIDGWFVVSNLAAALWLLAWVNEDISLSVILIFVQLLSLLTIHFRIGMYDLHRSAASRFFTQLPLSIYFGWMTVATIANTSGYLNSTDWDGWGLDPVDWTNIMIGVTVFIAVLVIAIRRNVFFGLAIIWGLYGIILKRMEVDKVLYYHILRTAWIGISVLGLVAVLRIIRNRIVLKQGDTFPVASQPLK